MKREEQIYNALVIFADLVGARVAAHIKADKPLCQPEETFLSVDEAAEIFCEWQNNLKQDDEEGED